MGEIFGLKDLSKTHEWNTPLNYEGEHQTVFLLKIDTGQCAEREQYYYSHVRCSRCKIWPMLFILSFVINLKDYQNKLFSICWNDYIEICYK